MGKKTAKQAITSLDEIRQNKEFHQTHSLAGCDTNNWDPLDTIDQLSLIHISEPTRPC